MKRVAKNKDVLETLKEEKREPGERVYFFCMLKVPGTLKDRNQKVPIDICRKKECEYLEESPELRCHCPVSMQYVDAFKGNWKKRRDEAQAKKEKEEQE